MTTRDHPWSKQHGPRPTVVGGPWNLKNHWISPSLHPTFGSDPIQADEEKDNKELKSVIESIIKEDPLV